jgi:hypothetical protein
LRPSAGQTSDRACYDLSVDNIAIRQTQATKVTADGLNRIEIWAVFRPIDQMSDPLFFRARRELRVDESQDVVDPPTGFVAVVPADFVLVGPH